MQLQAVFMHEVAWLVLLCLVGRRRLTVPSDTPMLSAGIGRCRGRRCNSGTAPKYSNLSKRPLGDINHSGQR